MIQLRANVSSGVSWTWVEQHTSLMAHMEAAAMMQQPRVLAVTKHIVAVNKPHGMSFHNDQKEAAGLVVALRELGGWHHVLAGNVYVEAFCALCVNWCASY